METVQLQCGSCQNVMAISVEHLGAQVQCPHCAAVVQTPPRSALGGPPPGPDPYGAAVTPSAPPPPAPPPPSYNAPSYQPPAYQQPSYAPPEPPPAPPSIQVPDRESIFGDPEPSDDLFNDGPAAPKIQMPEPAGAYAPSYSVPAPAPAPYSTPDAYAPAEAPVEEVPAESEEEQVDLSAMRNRLAAERKASSLAPTLLVFLIPYAIFTSAFIGYLLYMWPKIEAFDYLPDPQRDKSKQPRTVSVPAHDLPVPAKNRVALGQTFRIGAMEITPVSVTKDPKNFDLTLTFKAKNISKDQLIRPIDYDFFRDARSSSSYTFLEPIDKNALAKADAQAEKGEKIERGDASKGARVYGGDLEGDRDLGPNEECTIKLSTSEGDTTRRRVGSLLAKNGDYLWRVQVRRGLTPIHGSQLSMTSVVGVPFSATDIKQN